MRLLERRSLEAEFQKKLLQRKVDEARLENQSQLIVYGAALGASVLSTALMHPVDTVKVRKQALSAEKLKATAAAEFVGGAAEETAFAVASAATVAASAAVDARASSRPPKAARRLPSTPSTTDRRRRRADPHPDPYPDPYPRPGPSTTLARRRSPRPRRRSPWSRARERRTRMQTRVTRE